MKQRLIMVGFVVSVPDDTELDDIYLVIPIEQIGVCVEDSCPLAESSVVSYETQPGSFPIDEDEDEDEDYGDDAECLQDDV